MQPKDQKSVHASKIERLNLRGNSPNKLVFIGRILLAFLLLGLTHCSSKSGKTVQIQNPLPLASSPAPLPAMTSQTQGTSSFEFPVRSAGTQFALLKTEQELFSFRWQLLSNAKRSVRIQTYNFSGDESGWAFAQKLVELKRKGLTIEVMMDISYVTNILDHFLYFYLYKNGINVRGYHSYFYQRKNQDGSSEPLLQQLEWFNKRAHEKLFLVDAEIDGSGVGIVGGTNIDNAYFGIKTASDLYMFKDTDLAFRGTAVKDALSAFNQSMAVMAVNEAKFHSAGGNFLQNLMDTIDGTAGSFGAELYLNSRLGNSMTASLNNLKSAHVNLAWSDGPVQYFHSFPDNGYSSIYAWYIKMIDEAKSTIVISNAYFIPSLHFISRIHAALARGVSVRILTNSLEKSDVPYIQLAGRSRFPPLLNHSYSDLLQLFEWKPVSSVDAGSSGANHSKFAVFDSAKTFVGSYNIDPRSQNINTENGLALESREVADFLINRFKEDAAEFKSQLITLQILKDIESKYDKETKTKDILAKTIIEFL